VLPGDFERNLKILNKSLRIFAGSDNSKAAGLFTVIDGEYVQICGVDKNTVPEYPIYDKYGHILKSGWKRVLNILIKMKYINKFKALSVFKTGSLYISKDIFNNQNYIDKYINDAEIRNFNRTGKPGLTRNDILDISSVLGRN